MTEPRKPGIEVRREVRRAMKRIKRLDGGYEEVCPCGCGHKFNFLGLPKLSKEKEDLRAYIKKTCEDYQTEFDFPEGRTDFVVSNRESYDLKQLEELIESGQIDPDTAAIIRACKKQTVVTSMYIR